MRFPIRRGFQRGLIGSFIVLLSACSGTYPQTTFEPVSEFGRALNRLFANTFWWTIGILVLVEILVIYAMIRFRAREGQPRPKQIHGNVKLELLWTLIPAIIVLFIAVPTIQTTFTTQQRAPDDALVIELIGHQWWWEFRYPEYNVVTANELVLPVGRPVDLKMHSADVIHSFWIPRVGGKRDVNPPPRVGPGEAGPRSNHLTFTIDQPDYYFGQCAEFCGASHAIMRTAIVAVQPQEFDSWVTAMGGRRVSVAAPPPATPPQPADTANPNARVQPADTAASTPAPSQSTAPVAAPRTPVQSTPAPTAPLTEAQRGQQLFTTRACLACHTIQGTTARGVLGPNLTRFGARRYLGAGARKNTQENLEAWIRHPAAIKPGVLMPGARVGAAGMPPTGLTDADIRAIATYLLSLK